MKEFKKYALRPAKFMLPGKNTEMEKWAVVACDQYTSQTEYWAEAERIVGDAPSSLHIVYPEAWLGKREGRIESIGAHMRDYVENVLCELPEGFVLVERGTTDGVRIGLLGVIDLEQYDFAPGSRSAVRPTEGTVAERVPPRVQVRSKAPIEAGHVLLMADDPACALVEPLYARREEMPLLYDFELMLGGGHIRGWHVGPEFYPLVLSALERLRQNGGGLDLAVGDGNHSLAAARTCWQEIRDGLSDAEREEHPARFAMAEVVNLHSPSMAFHPIHRALFGECSSLQADFAACLRAQGMDIVPGRDGEADLKLNGAPYDLVNPVVPLPVGVVQPFLDEWLAQHPGVTIDYIHGGDVLSALQAQGAFAIWVPAMDKADLFPSVSIGPLPRKTFSMGKAADKRYYLETRRIR